MLLVVVKYLSSIFGSVPQAKEVLMGHELLAEVSKPIGQCDEKKACDLIDQGAHLQMDDGDGMDAALTAAWYGHTNIYKKLIEKGVDGNHENNLQETALMIVASKGHRDLADFILNRPVSDGGLRCDAEKKNYFGDSALSMALRNGHQDIAAMLRKRVGEKEQRAAELRAKASSGPAIW